MRPVQRSIDDNPTYLPQRSRMLKWPRETGPHKPFCAHGYTRVRVGCGEETAYPYAG